MPKGFHNSKFHLKNGKEVERKGYKKQDIYGTLELRAMQLFNGFFEEHKAIHEKCIKGKTSKGSKTVRFAFWCDFFLPLKKLDLEIDPAFHKTYPKVANRDLIRTSLLKRKHNVNTMRIGALDLTEDRINEIKAQIDALPISPEILDYYL